MRRHSLSSGRGARGIAEIVGTLMLILIVVAAAIALAAFVASAEKQYLAQQSYTHDKDLENLRVVSIQPQGLNSTSGDYTLLDFTVASTDPNPTTITGILVDGDVVTNYTVTTTSDPSPTFGVPFFYTLPPTGVVTIGVTFVPWTSSTLGPVHNSFETTGLVLSANVYLEINLYTGYDNDFVFTALPPVPIIKVDVLSLGSTYATVLDGTGSFLPAGQNATLVSWAWNGTAFCTGSGCTIASESLVEGGWLPQLPTYGADVETSIPLAPNSGPSTSYNYSLTLTVTSSDGLDGTVTVLYSPG